MEVNKVDDGWGSCMHELDAVSSSFTVQNERPLALASQALAVSDESNVRSVPIHP